VPSNFSGTCILKDTTDDKYIIYRGEKSENHTDGNGQYISHASRLVASVYYSGQNYSWGDEETYNYSLENINDRNRKTGNAETWVRISQNHHMTHLNDII